MGNSKSAEVAKRVYEERATGRNPFIAKPRTDTKAGTKIVSRIPGLQVETDLVYSTTDNLYATIKQRDSERKIDVVIVDEAQFSTDIQIEELAKVAWQLIIPVLCYGLKHDFQSKLFPGSKRLIELANRLIELERIKLCPCGEKAEFNVRKINGSYTFTGNQILIDNSNEVEYISICSTCFMKAGGIQT